MTGIQWVASEAWVTARLLTSPSFQPLLEGTLGFSFPGVHIPGLAEFLLNIRPDDKPGMELINVFWEEQFGCRLNFRGVTSKENTTVAGERVPGFDFDSKLDSVEGNKSWSSFRLNESRKSTLGQSSDNQANEKPFCTGSEDLRATDRSYTDMSQFRISYHVYKAVYTIANALHTLLKCDSSNNTSGTCMRHQTVTSKQVS